MQFKLICLAVYIACPAMLFSQTDSDYCKTLKCQGKMESHEGIKGWAISQMASDSPLQGTADWNLDDVLLVTAVNSQRIVSFSQFTDLLQKTDSQGRIVVDAANKFRNSWWRHKVTLNLEPTDSAKTDAPKIHILLCASTGDHVVDAYCQPVQAFAKNDEMIFGRSCAINLCKMNNLLESQIKESRIGNKVILRNNLCNSAGIIDAISEMAIAPNDTLFVYYSGHGAYVMHNEIDANEEALRNHYFDLDNRLMRAELYKTMLAKNARLTVLISDSCNIATLPILPNGPPLTGPSPNPVPPVFTNLEKLLLRYRGDLNINSSSPKEFAFLDDQNGGWFTFFLHRAISSGESWQAVFERARIETNEFFKSNQSSSQNRNNSNLQKQDAQMAVALSLDVEEVTSR